MPADEKDLSTQVAELRSDVRHVQADAAEIKVDIREIKKGTLAMSLRIDAVGIELGEKISAAKIWGLGLYGSLLSILAHGFKWL